jgi:hypothetical protein
MHVAFEGTVANTDLYKYQLPFFILLENHFKFYDGFIWSKTDLGDLTYTQIINEFSSGGNFVDYYLEPFFIDATNLINSNIGLIIQYQNHLNDFIDNYNSDNTRLILGQAPAITIIFPKSNLLNMIDKAIYNITMKFIINDGSNMQLYLGINKTNVLQQYNEWTANTNAVSIADNIDNYKYKFYLEKSKFSVFKYNNTLPLGITTFGTYSGGQFTPTLITSGVNTNSYDIQPNIMNISAGVFINIDKNPKKYTINIIANNMTLKISFDNEYSNDEFTNEDYPFLIINNLSITPTIISKGILYCNIAVVKTYSEYATIFS